MKELDNRLRSAFDAVHAAESLKDSARAYVRKEVEKHHAKPFASGFRLAAVLTCMLLVFFSGYFSRMYFEPVSVISIDINPSLELGINTFDHVVRVEPLNEDGRELADHLQLRFLNYEEAVERIVSSDMVEHLLEQEEELIIAVVGEDELRNAKLCENLENYTESQGSRHCYYASPENVEHAHSCGMSYGKYLAYQKALQQDADLTAEEAKNMTMKEIREITEKSCHTDSVSEATEGPAEIWESHHSHERKKHQNGHH